MICLHHIDTLPLNTEFFRKKKPHPNIQFGVGGSLGGSVAFELQKHHRNVQYSTYSAPIIYLKGMMPNYDNRTVEI